jgi:hypothetical protein
LGGSLREWWGNVKEGAASSSLMLGVKFLTAAPWAFREQSDPLSGEGKSLEKLWVKL